MDNCKWSCAATWIPMYPNLTCWLIFFILFFSFPWNKLLAKLASVQTNLSLQRIIFLIHMYFAVSTYNPYAVFSTYIGYLRVCTVEEKLLARSPPCPIHPKWVDSSEALYDLTRFACYISTWFAGSRVSQIDFQHDKSTTWEMICVNVFKPPCIALRKSRPVK